MLRLICLILNSQRKKISATSSGDLKFLLCQFGFPSVPVCTVPDFLVQSPIAITQYVWWMHKEDMKLLGNIP